MWIKYKARTFEIKSQNKNAIIAKIALQFKYNINLLVLIVNGQQFEYDNTHYRFSENTIGTLVKKLS